MRTVLFNTQEMFPREKIYYLDWILTQILNNLLFPFYYPSLARPHYWSKIFFWVKQIKFHALYRSAALILRTLVIMRVKWKLTGGREEQKKMD